MERLLTIEQLEQLLRHLYYEEKSTATVKKYLRDVRAFFVFMKGEQVFKEQVIAYKTWLVQQQYAVASINSMLASVNSFLNFMNWSDSRVKELKAQRPTYSDAGRELTREEYERLIAAANAGGKRRLSLVLQTICSTGIRVSELTYFTVKAVKKGEICVCCKNKNRKLLLPKELRKKLLCYAGENKIMQGAIFRTRTGRPLDRSNINTEMKALCKIAKVSPKKVFPHNLRKLFARTFYKRNKDIAKLADILGHSSINTTRIYIMSTGREHQEEIEQLGLVVDEHHIMDIMWCDQYTNKQ